MATTILSGRSLILTIATKDYSDQILTANLTIATDRLTFDTIAGRAYKYIDSNTTLDLEFLNDIGETDSITKALWDATETAPDTTLAAILTAKTGKTFTFSVLPSWPSQGGTGSDAQKVSVSLQVVGAITESL